MTAEHFEKLYEKEDPWSLRGKSQQILRLRVLDRVIRRYLTGQKVIEGACGEGVLTKEIISKCVDEFDAFDISANAVKRAQKLGLTNGRFSVSDMVSYHYDPRFDAVLLIEALYYLDAADQVTVLDKIKAMAGGTASQKPVSAETKILFLSCPVVGKTKDRKYYTRDEIVSLLQKHGFRIVSEHNLNIFWFENRLVHWMTRFIIAAFRFRLLPLALIDWVPLKFIYQRLFVCFF